MNPESTTIKAWVPAWVRDRLDREAGQRGVTLGQVVREYLERGFKLREMEERHQALMKAMNGG